MLKKVRNIIMPLIFVVIGVFSGVLIGRTMDKILPEDASMAETFLCFGLLLLTFYLVIMLQIAIHEAGHLLFGLLSGYRFVSYRIFSLMWIRDGEKLRFRRFSLAGTGGQCLMEPPEMVEGDFPVILYNLGGSLLNLITAAVFFLLSLPLEGYPVLWIFFVMLSLVGLVYAVINGVPIRTSMLNNDGVNAIELQRDEAARRAFWIQMKINARISAGERLKCMPEEWFEVPNEAEMNNSMCSSAAVFAANRLMDQREFDKADILMAYILERAGNLPGIYRYMLVNDRIFCELMGENRGEVIDGMMTKEQRRSMKTLKSQPSVLRTAYACELLRNRDRKQAEVYENEFQKLMKNYPYPEEGKAERELMDLAAELAGKEA